MLQPNKLPLYFPELEAAISPLPPIVSPDTLAIDAIARMRGIANGSILSDATPPSDRDSRDGVGNDCLLVMEGSEFRGIFRDRDVVRLCASEANLGETRIASAIAQPAIAVAKSEVRNLFSILEILGRYDIQHLPIADDTGNFLGIVTEKNIFNALQPVHLLEGRSVGEVMNRNAIVARPTTSLQELARLMSAHQMTCVPIVQPVSPGKAQFQIAIGIVSDRDLVQSVALGWDLKTTPAQIAIKKPLLSVQPRDSLWIAHQMMQQHQVGEILVMGEAGEVLGWVTQSIVLSVFDPAEMYGAIERLQRSLVGRLDELNQQNEQLQQEIQQHQQTQDEINQALEKEKELSALKSHFTAMVTHEFRNPLSTILCAVNLLEKFGDRASSEKKLSYLQRIQKTAKYMNQTIDDLLVLGGVATGKLEFKPERLDLRNFCLDLVEEANFVDRRRHQILFTSDIASAHADLDEKLLRYILVNLLTNACKYSPLGSPVDFHVNCQENQVIFQVRDRGIGILPEDRQRLFESFHRGKNVGSIPGTGLGLTIVKNCVEVCGGEIVVESEVNTGTTFIVTLPFHP